MAYSNYLISVYQGSAQSKFSKLCSGVARWYGFAAQEDIRKRQNKNINVIQSRLGVFFCDFF